MKTSSLFTLLCLLFTQSVLAQTGHSIVGKLKGVDGSKPIFLVGYYADQYILADTAKFDANSQTFKFEHPNKQLDAGQYFVAIDKTKSIDLLINESQHFSFEADTAHVLESTTFKNSKENEIFYGYFAMNQSFRKQLEEERIAKNWDYKSTDYQEKAKSIQAEMDAYTNKLIKKHKNEFVGKLIKSYREPVLPEFKKLNGEIDSLRLYYYHKNHYFENLDLTDERMLRTPVAIPRVKIFFKNMILAISKDTAIAEIDKLMALTKGKLLRKNVVLAIGKKYEMPSFLGLDGTYPHLLDKYYINEPDLWDSSSVVQAKRIFAIQNPLILGKILPDMMLFDTLQLGLVLSEVKAKYTMVYIYNPDCGACKKTTPMLPAFFEEIKKKYDLKIFAASVGHDSKRWREFIREANIGGLLNGMDPFGQIDFDVYNNYNFPNIYLLDEEKRIFAKHVGLSQVKDLLNSHQEYLDQKAKQDTEKK